MTSASDLTRKDSRSAPKLSFSGHETFVFRYGWLKKAVDGVSDDHRLFTSDEAMVLLGVGKNMVRSIRHWALATTALAEKPRTRGLELIPTAFGDFLFGSGGADPYLEDLNSLWLLHWALATNEERSTTWCWAFNLIASTEFTRESLFEIIKGELRKRAADVPSDHTLERDIDCFVRSYTASRTPKAVLEDSLDCPLAELELVEEDRRSGVLHTRRGPQDSLADEVFVFALIEFWDRLSDTRQSLAFSDIAYGFGSPGSVFKLDEDGLVERLERLEDTTRGSISYAETAGLKQVYRKGSIPPFSLLQRYYQVSAAALMEC